MLWVSVGFGPVSMVMPDIPVDSQERSLYPKKNGRRAQPPSGAWLHPGPGPSLLSVYVFFLRAGGNQGSGFRVHGLF